MKDIKYINRDFSSFNASLQQFIKSYFPNTYTDFKDEDPGNMFMEAISYIGDVLSFYTDKSVQENFLQYAQQKESLLALSYMLGYRPKVTSTATVKLDVYQQLPAKIANFNPSPDFDYCMVVDKDAKIKSAAQSDVVFITQDSVDFSYSSSYSPTEISVYQIDPSTNQPEYYIAKKSVDAVAGTIKTTQFNFGQPQKFASVELQDKNIIQILSVVDSDGNKWYEVPYLAQDTIFEEVQNNYLNAPNSFADKLVPYVIRLRKVQRRFVARFNAADQMTIEFGAGISSSPDEEIIPNPSNVGTGLVDAVSKLNVAYDPSNFLVTREYGLAPSNTTLTVTYLVGGGVASNAPSNSITQVYESKVSPVSMTPNALNQNLLNYITRTIAFNNAERASGGGDGDSLQDLRLRAAAAFPTQLRSVTNADHEIRALSMPPKFGAVAKVKVVQDNFFINSDSDVFVNNNPFALSMYILSYDDKKKLAYATDTLKQNLKNYLSIYKISTDAINIKNAYFVNIGVNFDIIVLPAHNGREILINCLNAVKEYFNVDNWQIGQPIVLAELFNLIAQVAGVQSVVKVDIINKWGTDKGYSEYGYDIKAATRNNIIYTSIDPSVFEVRFPDTDIQGKIVTY
jgi:hypothetical protein